STLCSPLLLATHLMFSSSVQILCMGLVWSNALHRSTTSTISWARTEQARRRKIREKRCVYFMIRRSKIGRLVFSILTGYNGKTALDVVFRKRPGSGL